MTEPEHQRQQPGDAAQPRHQRTREQADSGRAEQRSRMVSWITPDSVVSVALALTWLAAVFSHHGILAVALAILTGGLWLARRHS